MRRRSSTAPELASSTATSHKCAAYRDEPLALQCDARPKGRRQGSQEAPTEASGFARGKISRGGVARVLKAQR